MIWIISICIAIYIVSIFICRFLIKKNYDHFCVIDFLLCIVPILNQFAVIGLVLYTVSTFSLRITNWFFNVKE